MFPIRTYREILDWVPIWGKLFVEAWWHWILLGFGIGFSIILIHLYLINNLSAPLNFISSSMVWFGILPVVSSIFMILIRNADYKNKPLYKDIVDISLEKIIGIILWILFSFLVATLWITLFSLLAHVYFAENKNILEQGIAGFMGIIFLLIVFAFITGIHWAFVSVGTKVLILDQVSGLDSFSESFRIVIKNPSRTLLFIILSGLVFLVGILAFGIGIIVSFPLIMILGYLFAGGNK